MELDQLRRLRGQLAQFRAAEHLCVHGRDLRKLRAEYQGAVVEVKEEESEGVRANWRTCAGWAGRAEDRLTERVWRGLRHGRDL